MFLPKYGSLNSLYKFWSFLISLVFTFSFGNNSFLFNAVSFAFVSFLFHPSRHSLISFILSTLCVNIFLCSVFQNLRFAQTPIIYRMPTDNNPVTEEFEHLIKFTSPKILASIAHFTRMQTQQTPRRVFSADQANMAA